MNSYELSRKLNKMKIVVHDKDGSASIEKLRSQIENSASVKRRNSKFYEMTPTTLNRGYGIDS